MSNSVLHDLSASDALDLLSKLFNKDFPSEISMMSTKNESIMIHSEFSFPKHQGANSPVMFAVERNKDEKSYPWVRHCDHFSILLYDGSGDEVGRISVFMIDAPGGQIDELSCVSDDYSSVVADRSWFFLHNYFVNAPKDTRGVLFIEDLWVHESIRKNGFGKWLIGAAVRRMMWEYGIDPDMSSRFLLGVVPFPKEAKGDGDVEQLVLEETKLFDYYRKVFALLEKTEAFSSASNFSCKEDRGEGAVMSVLCWEAGGTYRHDVSA